MALREYHRKRAFHKTPEPRGTVKPKREKKLIFVVQKHAASRLHYDFRLELDGVLKSWAVPKGPSLDPKQKRLAVHVEDHPFDYKDFEGIIPAGEYGGGTVLLWDQGLWIPEGDPHASYQKGHLRFQLQGKKLKGAWTLLRMKSREGTDKNWLLIKTEDKESSSRLSLIEKKPQSVLTGRSLEEIAHEKDRVWKSGRKKDNISKKENLKLPAGVQKASLPSFIRPQLATLTNSVPTGDDWVHEIKFDGYRILARIQKNNVRLLTRKNNDWTSRFSDVAAALKDFAVEEALLDGEVVKLLPNGTSSFQALQNALSLEEGGFHYYIFDLLHYNGWSFLKCSLKDRQDFLRRLVHSAKNDVLRFSEGIQGRGAYVYRESCRNALEGLVSKKYSHGYESGRSRHWLKTKCVHRQEFVIAGFTKPGGSRTGFGCLVLAARDAGGALRYTGRVGTGFTQESIRQVSKKLEKMVRKDPPFPLRSGFSWRGVQWVEPRLVAEVEFTEWTRDGVLRHSSFEGLREDKSDAEVVIEKVKSQNKIAGIVLTHPDKILYPDQGITKRELASYYEKVADRILPYLINRPISLVRCPEGSNQKCFYQKHVTESSPKALKKISIQEKEGSGFYVMVDDLPGLISLVQMGVLEIHPWGASGQDIEHPDIMVFDLDPDPSVSWMRVVAAAKSLHILLKKKKLKSFLKTTGGKGLHVVVPLARAADWDAVKAYSKAVVQEMVQEDPSRYTHELLKAKRKGKIFIDYLRNGRGATAIAPYSTRARTGAPIAVPLFWEEIDRVRSAQFNIRNIKRRLVAQKKDPWVEFFSLRQEISKTP